MNNINERKRGITLIESIISVALFSILIIPISSMIMSSVSTTKKADNIQRASYIGQCILEEINAYEKIVLKPSEINSSKMSFKLLDGDEIYSMDSSNNICEGNFSREEFKIEVILSKNSDFEYEDSVTSNNSDNTIDFKFELLNENNITKIRYNSEVKSMSKKSVLKIDEFGNMKLINKEDNSIIFRSDKGINSKNEILIFLNKNFDDNEILIEVENEKLNSNMENEPLDIYVKKEGYMGNVDIKPLKGKIKLYENQENTISEETGDLYNIEVSVRKKENVLFTGKINKNIVIN